MPQCSEAADDKSRGDQQDDCQCNLNDEQRGPSMHRSASSSSAFALERGQHILTARMPERNDAGDERDHEHRREREERNACVDRDVSDARQIVRRKSDDGPCDPVRDTQTYRSAGCGDDENLGDPEARLDRADTGSLRWGSATVVTPFVDYVFGP
jgi:hypothetical protein